MYYVCNPANWLSKSNKLMLCYLSDTKRLVTLSTYSALYK